MVEVTAELIEVTKMVLDKPQRWGKGYNYAHGRVCLFGAMGVASHIGLPEREAAEMVTLYSLSDPRGVMIGCTPEEGVGRLKDVQNWQDKDERTLKEVHQFLDCCIEELRK